MWRARHIALPHILLFDMKEPILPPRPAHTTCCRAQASGKAVAAKRRPSRRDPRAVRTWVGAGQPCRMRARRPSERGRGERRVTLRENKYRGIQSIRVMPCCIRLAHVQRCSGMLEVLIFAALNNIKLGITEEANDAVWNDAHTVMQRSSEMWICYSNPTRQGEPLRSFPAPLPVRT